MMLGRVVIMPNCRTEAAALRGLTAWNGAGMKGGKGGKQLTGKTVNDKRKARDNRMFSRVMLKANVEGNCSREF